MPNFKLGTGIREHIKRSVESLTTCSVAHSQGGFPLTAHEVQVAVMKPQHLQALQELAADGLADLPRNKTPSVYVGPEYIPGLQRRTLLGLTLTEAVFVPQSNHADSGAGWSEGNVREALRLDVGFLDDAKKAELATWVNRVVRAQRLKRLTDWTFDAVLTRCQTVGHVMAWAPSITSVVTDRFWLDRFHNPPKNLKPYAPAAGYAEHFKKHLDAAEVVLAGAQLLSEYKPDNSVDTGWVCSFEKLETDPAHT